MNLQLVTAKIVAPDGTVTTKSVFVGSQAEAATLRAKLVADTPRKNITTTAIEVPTDKAGLMGFLNLVAESPSVAAAAQRLVNG